MPIQPIINAAAANTPCSSRIAAGDRQADEHELAEQRPDQDARSGRAREIFETAVACHRPTGAARNMPISTIVVASPAPSRSSARQAEHAVNQAHRPASALAGIAAQRDPERWLRPVDCAHEAAQRDEQPRRASGTRPCRRDSVPASAASSGVWPNQQQIASRMQQRQR